MTLGSQTHLPPIRVGPFPAQPGSAAVGDDLVAAHFTRREPARQAGKYIDALMSDLPDKNCWSLAQHAGNAAPGKMQRLLERAAWDQAAAMGTIRDFAVAGLTAPDGLTVLVPDESGQVKQDERTAGSQTAARRLPRPGRQRDQLRERDLLHRAGPHPGRLPAAGSRRAPGRAYVRDMMGIPAHLRPATRPQPGAQMLAEMPGAGIEIPWVAADEVYGQDPGLRELCEERGAGYMPGRPARSA